jgi:hypothetical protein
VVLFVAERRLTLARPFKAGNCRGVRSRRVATPETGGLFNRRSATGPIHDLIPALKGRAKVSRRSATKNTTRLPHYFSRRFVASKGQRDTLVSPTNFTRFNEGTDVFLIPTFHKLCPCSSTLGAAGRWLNNLRWREHGAILSCPCSSPISY